MHEQLCSSQRMPCAVAVTEPSANTCVSCRLCCCTSSIPINQPPPSWLPACLGLTASSQPITLTRSASFSAANAPNRHVSNKQPLSLVQPCCCLASQ